MSSTSRDALWFIDSRDLPHIKQVLNVILGDVAGPSLRLEIFARMAGFQTYAGLRARMEHFTDINGDPFPLRLNPQAVRDDKFFASLDAGLRRRIASLDETGLIRLVIAGLVQARHPILGDLGLPEGVTIDQLRETAQRVFHPTSPDSARSTPKAARPCALVLSPENTKDLLGRPVFLVLRFAFSSSEDIPREPDLRSFEATSSPDRLADLIAGRTVYTYSVDDIFAVRSAIQGRDADRPSNFVELKNMTARMLEVDAGLGFEQMASAFDCSPVGDNPELTAEQQCMEWLIDMMLVVEAYHELAEEYSTASTA